MSDEPTREEWDRHRMMSLESRIAELTAALAASEAARERAEAERDAAISQAADWWQAWREETCQERLPLMNALEDMRKRVAGVAAALPPRDTAPAPAPGERKDGE
jgi:hypothetical protein